MLSDRTLTAVFGLRPRTASLWGDFIRAATAMLGLLVVAAHVLVYAQVIATTVHVRVFEDYGIFDDSTRRLVSGDDLYAQGPTPAGRNGKPRAPNLNPPHFHLLMLPLTAVPPVEGFAIWMLASGAAFAMALTLGARTVRLTMGAAALLGVAAFISPPMIATLITGQVGLLLLVPFTMAWLRLRQGRDVAAGVWLGVCAGVKLFFLLFIVYFAVVRRPRAAAAMMVTIAAVFGAGLAVFGMDAYLAWLRQLGAVTWAEHYMNGSLLGLVERSLSTSEWRYVPLVSAPWLIRPVWVVAVALVVIRALDALDAHPSVDRQVLIVTTAMLLLSPLGWVYYHWLLLPPLAALLAEGRLAPGRRSRMVVAIGVGLLLVPAPLPWLSLQWGYGLVTATLGGVYTWGMLVVFLGATSQGPVASSRGSAP